MRSKYLILFFVLTLLHSCAAKDKLDKTDYFDLSEALESPESVISLDLEGDSLCVFPSIFSMKNLRYLTLTNNCISSIPDEIASLSKLSYINLKDNEIHYVPSALGDIDSLKIVYLMFNPIDSISPGLCNSSSLIELNLSGIEEVFIPTCLKTHPGLKIY